MHAALALASGPAQMRCVVLSGLPLTALASDVRRLLAPLAADSASAVRHVLRAYAPEGFAPRGTWLVVLGSEAAASAALRHLAGAHVGHVPVRASLVRVCPVGGGGDLTRATHLPDRAHKLHTRANAQTSTLAVAGYAPGNAGVADPEAAVHVRGVARGTRPDDLRGRFASAGLALRGDGLFPAVRVSPDGTAAVVQFASRADAQRAVLHMARLPPLYSSLSPMA